MGMKGERSTVGIEAAYIILNQLHVDLGSPHHPEKFDSYQRDIYKTVKELVKLYPSRLDEVRDHIRVGWLMRKPLGKQKLLYDLSQRLKDALQHYKAKYQPERQVRASRQQGVKMTGGDNAVDVGEEEKSLDKHDKERMEISPQISRSKRNSLNFEESPSKRSRPVAASHLHTISSALLPSSSSPYQLFNNSFETIDATESLESIHITSPNNKPSIANPSTFSLSSSTLSFPSIDWSLTPATWTSATCVSPDSSQPVAAKVEEYNAPLSLDFHPPSDDEEDLTTAELDLDTPSSSLSSLEGYDEFIPSKSRARLPSDVIEKGYRNPPPPSEQWITVLPRSPYHAYLQKYNVPYGIQWELERLLALDKVVDWNDFVLEDLKPLWNKSAADSGPKISQILSKVRSRKLKTRDSDTSRTKDREALWVQMDREEEIIRNQHDKAVVGDQGWYGGKIVYTVAVLRATNEIPGVRPTSDPNNRQNSDVESKVANRMDFRFGLRPVEMPGKSFRLARRLGSRKILTFKFASEIKRGKPLLDLFVGRRFWLFGKVFRPFWAKPDSGSLFAVQESGDVVGDFDFISLLNGFNSLELRKSQAVAKWAARPQLLFSDSIPATSVDPTRWKIIPDIVCARVSGKATTEQILTDGCGLMSQALADRIFQHPEVSRTNSRPPCTVQMRFGGSKGLLALMSPEQSRQYKNFDIILRQSMVKSFPSPSFENDPSLFVLDLLSVGNIKIGSSLSTESIIVMSHGGVPDQVFIDLFNEGLEEIKTAFLPTPHEGESEIDVLRRIDDCCHKYGGIRQEREKRRCRALGTSSRVAGVSNRFSDRSSDISEEEVVDEFDIDPVSGAPPNKAECLSRAIISGFRPDESRYVQQKLRYMVEDLADRRIRQFRIEVPQSATAFIVPDSLGLLAPDEISVFFSTTPSEFPTPWLEGDVLAYRSPCKLPTDVRKLKAVFRPELFYLKDCIVMSANSDLCSRSPASFLGGGDYDGDTVTVIWDKRLVEPFTNAPTHFAETESTFESENFQKNVTKVEEFIETLAGFDPEISIANLQTFLLGSIMDEGLVGRYSDIHGNAVYQYGLADERSVRLAKMFCHVLDARKSGLTVKPEVRRKDMMGNGGSLEWRDFKNLRDLEDRNTVPVQRSIQMGEFLMDKLMKQGKKKREELLSSFTKDWHHLSPNLGLTSYFQEMASAASKDENLADQLELLTRHVLAVRFIWNLVYQSRFPLSTTTIAKEYKRLVKMSTDEIRKETRSGSTLTLTSTQRVQCMSELAIIWHDGLTPDTVPWLDVADSLRRLKVSAAFMEVSNHNRQKHDGGSQKDDRFIFDLDFATACQLRAEMSGPLVSIAPLLYR